MTEECDLVQRDPQGIAEYLKIGFSDVLAEPDEIRSIDCVWKLSFGCFNCWKNLLYKIATTLFGICIAAEWGCQFAYIAFYHIWYITPFMKALEINCAIVQRIYGLCIRCCIDPCCEAFSILFTPFKRS